MMPRLKPQLSESSLLALGDTGRNCLKKTPGIQGFPDSEPPTGRKIQQLREGERHEKPVGRCKAVKEPTM